MKGIIKDFIYKFEKKYVEGVGKYEIEEMTGINYSKFSLNFKKICGMKLEKYITKRCLTKIILKIKEDNITMDYDNVMPYSSPQAFSQAFVNQFGISPRKLLETERECLLCEMIDIDKLYDKYIENTRIVKELVNEYYGVKKSALNYLLSLNSYSISYFDENFSHPLGIKYMILNKRYNDEIGNLISSESMSVDRYLEEIQILNKYYDINTCLSFPPVVGKESLFARKYFLVDRQLIDMLTNGKRIQSILKVNELETIFQEFRYIDKFLAINKIEEIMQYKYYFLGGEKYTLDKLDRLILKHICLQDIGIKEYNNLEKLIEGMKFELEFDVQTVEKKIIKLLKRGLLYLNESDNLDLEIAINKINDKEYKEMIKLNEQEGKVFLNYLRKIKKHIVVVYTESDITKVKYSYKAIKYIDGEFRGIGYRFIFKDKGRKGIYNIYSGYYVGSDYVELYFNLSSRKVIDENDEIKQGFIKKTSAIRELINKDNVGI